MPNRIWFLFGYGSSDITDNRLDSYGCHWRNAVPTTGCGKICDKLHPEVCMNLQNCYEVKYGFDRYSFVALSNSSKSIFFIFNIT